MRLVTASSLAAWVAVLSAQAPETALQQIRPELIRAHMQFLADDLLEGRGTGTRGFQLAANYVAAQFEALRLEPVGAKGSYFQAVPFVRASLEESRTSLVLTRGRMQRKLTFGKDFLVFGSVTREAVQVMGEVAFVGYGITAPERHYDDYADVDVRGKVVAVLSDPPPSFPRDPGRYYSHLRLKQENTQRHGAVAVLYLNTADNHLMWRETLRIARTFLDLKREIPHSDAFAFLSTAASERLFDDGPQSLSEVVQAAKVGPPPRFMLPTRATLNIRSRRAELQSPNVIARLPGAVRPDEYVLYVAHLDHVGISDPVDGDAIYNGAIDNASGVAAVLAIARAFTSVSERPARSILFLATAGEERGSLGSEYFSTHSSVRRPMSSPLSTSTVQR